MGERISVRFKTFGAVESLLASAAIFALAAQPRVLRALEPDVAGIAREAFCNRMLSVGVLRAVEAPPRQEAGDFRNRNAEHLLGKDMIDSLLKVRNLRSQTLGEAAGDFSQEHSLLRA